ncbi:hypothetical protein Vretimale_9045 [Volvox reticuliferus]|uniref:Uncharacterized protein n=1 Tax=Volvox reticuliferus TaxID=1737510 RepID=A0A8J4LPL8_9CHLO|nr:hypothetical protein Vretifemale_14283 [Volvox reticuliferus]GIM04530.1 hypothetical protein Vretimale_9045 [Volvox reticuliferus]
MRAFKTLDAYFKRVQMPQESGIPGPQSDNCTPLADNTTMGSIEGPQAENAEISPVPQSPVLGPPPAPISAPRPPTSSSPHASQHNSFSRLSEARIKRPSNSNGTTAPKPLSVSIPAVAVVRSKYDLLAEMLHGRRTTSRNLPSSNCDSTACGRDGVGASTDASSSKVTILALATGSHQGDKLGSVQLASAAAGDGEPRLRTAAVAAVAAASTDEAQQRPWKRTCLQARPAQAPAPSALQPSGGSRVAATAPLERRSSLVYLLHARSVGLLPPHRALWWNRVPRMTQVGCWSAAEGLRAASVVHQDAVTQIELSSDNDGRMCLAVAQANQRIRIVPYSVLRDFAEARRGERSEASELNGDTGSDDDEDEDDRLGGRNVGSRRQRQQPQPRLWQELVDVGRIHRACSGVQRNNNGVLGNLVADANGGDSTVAAARLSSVLTLNTQSNVACLGWDPRRRGRLALVDRISPSIMVLDLGWGPSGDSGRGPRVGGFTRIQLNVGVSVPGGAAARAMAYLKYGSTRAPYTLAGAGRASGEGAVVHLWDERRGCLPVSRLTCPGGASLLARMEPSLDGTALLGVVDPGTLVLWDIRRASSTAASSAVFNLGSAVPASSAVVGSWDLQAPLTAAGCRRFAISSLAPDPVDPSRTAVLLQDGSVAIWSLAAAAVTHAYPALTSPTALVPDAMARAPLVPSGTSAGATVGPPMASQQQLRPGPLIAVTETRVVDASELSSYCRLAGCELYGAWDGDVCGFWHPAAIPRTPCVSGDSGVGAWLGPGFVMTDCRTSCSSAMVRSPAEVGAAVVPVESRSTSPLLSRMQPAVSIPVRDWTLCMTCIPDSGDLVTGSLRGHLAYYWKA